MKIHTFEMRIVETRQDARAPFDEKRTKHELAVVAISVETADDAAPPSLVAVASAFRALEAAAAGKVGAR
jgi:hypothetical protein